MSRAEHAFTLEGYKEIIEEPEWPDWVIERAAVAGFTDIGEYALWLQSRGIDPFGKEPKEPKLSAIRKKSLEEILNLLKREGIDYKVSLSIVLDGD